VLCLLFSHSKYVFSGVSVVLGGTVLDILFNPRPLMSSGIARLPVLVFTALHSLCQHPSTVSTIATIVSVVAVSRWQFSADLRLDHGTKSMVFKINMCR
jgi:hypothetical protein